MMIKIGHSCNPSYAQLWLHYSFFCSRDSLSVGVIELFALGCVAVLPGVGLPPAGEDRRARFNHVHLSRNNCEGSVGSRAKLPPDTRSCLTAGLEKVQGRNRSSSAPLVTTPSGDPPGEAEMHTTDNDKRGLSRL